MKIKKFFNSIANLLYPPVCPFCGKNADFGKPTCDDCTNLLQNRFYVTSAAKNVCVYAFPYEDEYRKAVLNMKFYKQPAIAENLGVLAANAVLLYDGELAKNTQMCVTAVPLHKSSEAERGYNQSRLLAKSAARFLNFPYKDLLVKHTQNRCQHSLKRHERVINVQNVYSAAKNADVAGKTILLIDDIVTTGSTLGECAKVLLAAGAKRVVCAAVCGVEELSEI
ncbi:MAG: ComF family protein [Oscillospiraceae bacterium]|nr:ComF family protein [Oscillospiraceae bacterium]